MSKQREHTEEVVKFALDYLDKPIPLTICDDLRQIIDHAEKVFPGLVDSLDPINYKLTPKAWNTLSHDDNEGFIHDEY